MNISHSIAEGSGLNPRGVWKYMRVVTLIILADSCCFDILKVQNCLDCGEGRILNHRTPQSPCPRAGMEPPRDAPPALPPKTRARDQHSNLQHAAVNGTSGAPGADDVLPGTSSDGAPAQPSDPAPPLPTVPPRFRAQLKKDKRPVSNGLPPTPKVHVSIGCRAHLLLKCVSRVEFLLGNGAASDASGNLMCFCDFTLHCSILDGCLLFESLQRVSITYQLHCELGPPGDERWVRLLHSDLCGCTVVSDVIRDFPKLNKCCSTNFIPLFAVLQISTF